MHGANMKIINSWDWPRDLVVTFDDNLWYFRGNHWGWSPPRWRRLSPVFNYTLPLVIHLMKTAKNSESIAEWYGNYQASCPIGSLGYEQTTHLRLSRSIWDNALLVQMPANIGFLSRAELIKISQIVLWCDRWKIRPPNSHVFVCYQHTRTRRALNGDGRYRHRIG